MAQTYSTITSALRQFADNHLSIRRFKCSMVEQLDNFSTEGKSFPILFAAPLSVTMETNIDVFNYRIYCLDVLQKDRANEEGILNDTFLVLGDLVNWLRLDTMNDLNLLNDPQPEPVNNALVDGTMGWFMDIEIEGNGLKSDCAIPFTSNFQLTGITADISYVQRFLSCETLANCSTFTSAIANLQRQIDVQPREIAFGSAQSGLTSSQDFTVTNSNPSEFYANLGGVLVGTTGAARFIQGLGYDQLRILSRNSSSEINLNTANATITNTSAVQLFENGTTGLRSDTTGFKVTSVQDLVNPCTVKFEVGGASIFGGNVTIQTAGNTLVWNGDNFASSSRFVLGYTGGFINYYPTGGYAMRIGGFGLTESTIWDYNDNTVKTYTNGLERMSINGSGAVTVRQLSGTTGRFVQVDATGKLIATATTAGSSSTLQPTYVGFGSGASTLTGSSDFTFTAEDFENAPYSPSTTKLGIGATVFTSYDGVAPKLAIVEDRPFMIASTMQNTSTDPSAAQQFVMFNDQTTYFSLKKYPLNSLRSDFGNLTDMQGLTALHNTDDGYTPNRPIIVAGSPIYNSTGYDVEMSSRLDSTGFRIDILNNLNTTNTYPFQVTNMFYNGSYLNVGNGSNSARVGASGGTSYIHGVGTDFNVFAGSNLILNAGGTGNNLTMQSNGVLNLRLVNQQALVVDNGLNFRLTEGGLTSAFVTDKVSVVRQSSNAVRVALENRTGGTNSSAEYLIGEANGNGSIGRYNSTAVNNFSGTSIVRRNCLFVANTTTTGSTVEAASAIVVRGTPVVTLIGTSATNYGTRVDATGVTINNLNLLHLQSTARLDIGSASTAVASMRIRSGSTVSSPNDGDIWYDGTDLFARLAGANQKLNRTTSGTGFVNAWVNSLGNTQMAVNTGYRNFAATTGNTIFTLPTTSAIGDVLSISNTDMGKWVIGQNAGQYVAVSGGAYSSVGTGGGLTANTKMDSIELLCVSANTKWIITQTSQQPQYN